MGPALTTGATGPTSLPTGLSQAVHNTEIIPLQEERKKLGLGWAPRGQSWSIGAPGGGGHLSVSPKSSEMSSLRWHQGQCRSGVSSCW